MMMVSLVYSSMILSEFAQYILDRIQCYHTLVKGREEIETRIG
jgi:hypothetical protein